MRLTVFYLLLWSLASCDSKEIIQENQADDCTVDTLSVVNAYRGKQIENSTEPEIALKGTMILPDSHRTGRFNELSPFFLRSVNKSDCDNNTVYNEPNAKNHIEQIIRTDSTLIISYSLIETCGSDFLCEAEIVEGNCLNLIYHQYNSNADCRCILKLTYNFRVHSFYEPEFYDELKIEKIQYVSINGRDKFRLK